MSIEIKKLKNWKIEQLKNLLIDWKGQDWIGLVNTVENNFTEMAHDDNTKSKTKKAALRRSGAALKIQK